MINRNDFEYPILGDEIVRPIISNIMDNMFLPTFSKSLEKHVIEKSFYRTMKEGLNIDPFSQIINDKYDTVLGNCVFPNIIKDICNHNENNICTIIPTQQGKETIADLEITSKLSKIIKMIEVKASNISVNSGSRKRCIAKLNDAMRNDPMVEGTVCYMYSRTKKQYLPNQSDKLVKEYVGKFAWEYSTGYNCYDSVKRLLIDWKDVNKKHLNLLIDNFKIGK